METKLVAHAHMRTHAPMEQVWEALVNPEMIKQYMFGTTVVTDWKEGSPIVWKGEWKGKAYEDKGVILKNKKLSTLQYSHYSPLTGKPDIPENYHTVTIQLKETQAGVEIDLAQDNNENAEEQKHSEENWNAMLKGMKEFLEEEEEC